MSSLKKTGSTTRWRKIRERILRRDDYTCNLCGQYGDTVDHIIPRRLGGDDHSENLQTLCRRCNYSKGGEMPYSAKKPLNGPMGGFFDSAGTPPTPLVLDFPENARIVHYEDNQ